MKICYIAPVKDVEKVRKQSQNNVIVRSNALPVVAMGMSLIQDPVKELVAQMWHVGFSLGVCIAVIRIISVAIKCHKTNDYSNFPTVLSQCAYGVAGLWLLPYVLNYVDYIIAMISK